jgi:hypothetical protein
MAASLARMSIARLPAQPRLVLAHPRPPSRATSAPATSRMTGCGSRSPRIWSARSAKHRM